jgi:hypothetical protein
VTCLVTGRAPEQRDKLFASTGQAVRGINKKAGTGGVCLGGGEAEKGEPGGGSRETPFFSLSHANESFKGLL